jgi:ribosomal protein S18 acetylase RimI-like enzyme
VSVERLSWDSEFFGTPIGRADLSRVGIGDVIRDARAGRFACVYLTVPGDRRDLVSASIRIGGRFVALREELAASLPLERAAATDARLAAAGDREVVQALARRLAPQSRFAADPRFGLERSASMYAAWADRCLDAGKVAMAAQNEGFVGVTTDDGRADVALVYVEASASGRGLAKTLIAKALDASAAGRARVVTDVSNLRALRVYQSLGFKPIAVDAVLHLWLDEVDG